MPEEFTLTRESVQAVSRAINQWYYSNGMAPDDGQSPAMESREDIIVFFASYPIPRADVNPVTGEVCLNYCDCPVYWIRHDLEQNRCYEEKPAPERIYNVSFLQDVPAGDYMIAKRDYESGNWIVEPGAAVGIVCVQTIACFNPGDMDQPYNLVDIATGVLFPDPYIGLSDPKFRNFLLPCERVLALVAGTRVIPFGENGLERIVKVPSKIDCKEKGSAIVRGYDCTIPSKQCDIPESECTIEICGGYRPLAVFCPEDVRVKWNPNTLTWDSDPDPMPDIFATADEGACCGVKDPVLISATELIGHCEEHWPELLNNLQNVAAGNPLGFPFPQGFTVFAKFNKTRYDIIVPQITCEELAYEVTHTSTPSICKTDISFLEVGVFGNDQDCADPRTETIYNAQKRTFVDGFVVDQDVYTGTDPGEEVDIICGVNYTTKDVWSVCPIEDPYEPVTENLFNAVKTPALEDIEEIINGSEIEGYRVSWRHHWVICVDHQRTFDLNCCTGGGGGGTGGGGDPPLDPPYDCPQKINSTSKVWVKFIDTGNGECPDWVDGTWYELTYNDDPSWNFAGLTNVFNGFGLDLTSNLGTTGQPFQFAIECNGDTDNWDWTMHVGTLTTGETPLLASKPTTISPTLFQFDTAFDFGDDQGNCPSWPLGRESTPVSFQISIVDPT